MPGLRALLEAELPDVQESLRAAGAAKFDLLAALPPFWTDKSPRAIDDKLWTLTALRCSRTKRGLPTCGTSPA